MRNTQQKVIERRRAGLPDVETMTDVCFKVFSFYAVLI